MGLTAVAARAPRIGVYGGAFDPPHHVHVALVRAAVEQLQLDRIHVLPTGSAWHRPHPPTEAAHRLAMARLAFEGIAAAVVDDREIRRSGPTYTVDTLRELRAQAPGASLFLVLGQDQVQALASWREPEAVVELATICIAGRAGPAGAGAEFPSQLLPEGRLVRLHWETTPVSATAIRARVAAGLGAAPLVPDPVARYIAQNSLYLTA